MTVCLKCGAENASDSVLCGRCEMPLPQSGKGETLRGGHGRATADPVPTKPLGSQNDAQVARPNPVGAEPAEAPRAAARQTLFGLAPRPPAAAASAKPAGAQHTLLGMASKGPEQARPLAERPGARRERLDEDAAAPASEEAGGSRTLLGVAPRDLARAVELVRASANGTAPLHGEPELAAGAGRTRHGLAGAAFEPVRANATILGAAPTAPLAKPLSPVEPAVPDRSVWNDGVAPPRSVDAPGAATSAAAASLSAREDGPEPERPALNLNLHSKTHVGVAIPGVAPRRAGAAAAPRVTPPPAEATTAERPLDGTARVDESEPSLVVPLRFQLPRIALVLLGSGVVLLAAAAAFALLWRSSSPLSAVLGADAEGRDRIDIVCETCPDGTLVSLGSASTEVRERKAYLTPEQSLPLGESELSFALKRPDEEHAEAVAVKLPPVEYRITPDTTSLNGDPPRITLKIEALPGTVVTLADTPVTLDAEGRGAMQLDVSGQLTGEASEVKTFDQAIAYRITAPSGKTYEGKLEVRIAVTPLILEAPGADTVTDMERFMLAGRTSKGAQLSAAGNAVPVDATGRFAQLMSIDAVGETTVMVRASQPGLAPRALSFRLKRVKSLQSEATTLRRGALPLSAVARDTNAHLGSKVVVRGKIEDVRVDGHRTLVLLQADQDCEPRSCLVRLVYGGLRKLERGTTVTALGQLQRGAGAASVADVPEIAVMLLL